DDAVLSGLMLFAKKVAKQIESVIPCERIGVTVIGLEVPHAHVHLVPMNQMSDMNFSNPKKKFTTEQLTRTAAKIKNV
ncbi:MAG: histidine triad (HIT) family protein, partial [Urechidicola sp.]